MNSIKANPTPLPVVSDYPTRDILRLAKKYKGGVVNGEDRTITKRNKVFPVAISNPDLQMNPPEIPPTRYSLTVRGGGYEYHTRETLKIHSLKGGNYYCP